MKGRYLTLDGKRGQLWFGHSLTRANCYLQWQVFSRFQGYNNDEDDDDEDDELATIVFSYFVRYSHKIFENEDVPNSSSKFGEFFMPHANWHGHNAHEKTSVPCREGNKRIHIKQYWAGGK